MIEQVKARIAILESRQDAPNVQNYGRLSFSTHGLESNRVDSNMSSEPVHSGQGSMENATNEVGYLSVAAMGEPDRQDDNTYDNPSFATLVEVATKLSPDLVPSRRLPNTSSDPPHGISLLAIQEELMRLCRCDLQFFIDVYCSGMGQIYPCVPKASCHESLDTALQSERENLATRGQRASSEALLLVCFTASLGILNSPHYRSVRHPLERLMTGAMALLPSVVSETPDVEAVRVLLLASVLCLHRFEEASSWHLTGLAVTKAISAGLHRNKTPESSADDSSTLLWTLYKLDRAIAFVLDRPFSIEDGDMTIQLPQVTSLHAVGLPDVDLQPFFAWTVHYSHMLSGWRRQPVPDLEACRSSFAYWRETCHEFLISSQPVDGHGPTGKGGLSAIVNAVEAQLTCRALVHLFLRSLESQPPSSSFLESLSSDLEREVPQLLTRYKAAMDLEALNPSLVDASDILGAVTAYICSRQTFLLDQPQLRAQSGTTALAVPGMRLVTLYMNVLQKMADRFEPILDFQELLWCFLSALESRGESPDQLGLGSQRAASHLLKQALSRCRVPVPRHVAYLMERAIV